MRSRSASSIGLGRRREPDCSFTLPFAEPRSGSRVGVVFMAHETAAWRSGGGGGGGVSSSVAVAEGREEKVWVRDLGPRWTSPTTADRARGESERPVLWPRYTVRRCQSKRTGVCVGGRSCTGAVKGGDGDEGGKGAEGALATVSIFSPD